jgi:hypothetical protein
VVDGIHRKASLYAAKTVHNQKNKKLDIEGFLYSTNKGIVETEIHVVPLSGMTAMRGEGRETIGTIELRLYVTRQLGVSHALGNIQDYFNEQGNVEDEVPERAIYRRIEPTLRMEFEENCAPLDKSKANREQRRMGARRPGTEPWAIFRFHYRSEGEFSSWLITFQLLIGLQRQSLYTTWSKHTTRLAKRRPNLTR